MISVDALLFRLGDHRLAIELDLVSSVLDPEEARGMNRLDPRPYLRPELGRRAVPPEHRDPARVGLLNISGPPMVLVLGEVLGAETVTRRDLLDLPGWLVDFAPKILKPGCLLIDQKVVWILDLDTLTKKFLF